MTLSSQRSPGKPRTSRSLGIRRMPSTLAGVGEIHGLCRDRNCAPDRRALSEGALSVRFLSPDAGPPDRPQKLEPPTTGGRGGRFGRTYEPHESPFIGWKQRFICSPRISRNWHNLSTCPRPNVPVPPYSGGRGRIRVPAVGKAAFEPETPGDPGIAPD